MIRDNNTSTSKRVSFHTLGCKLNFSETSAIARQFTRHGFERVPPSAPADICVINTCSVTESADKKCRNLIRRLVRNNPGAIIAVTGCYAQLKAEQIAEIEGVDIVLGNNNKGELFRQVAGLSSKTGARIYSCDSSQITGFFASFSSGDRTRAFLKVQDGCSYKCSYCTIPYARGESRNISIEKIVGQAHEIASGGQKEIVITGINTGDFGRTTGESFLDLLIALDKVEGIERYRISSIEPNLLTDEIIRFTAASDKFQPHFHIPLQSGCDRILAAMKRRYDTARFRERILAVRTAIPGVFIGIDVIVGFPGETEEDFLATYSFIEELAPSFLHIFPYSARPGTPAAALAGKVPAQEITRRVKELSALGDKLHSEFCRRFYGEKAYVLYEGTMSGGLMHGFTGNYIKVETPYDRSRVNTITRVRLAEVTPRGNVRAEIAD